MFLSKLFYSAAALIVAACGGRLRTEVTPTGTYWYYGEADVAEAEPVLRPGGGERPGAPIGDFNVRSAVVAALNTIPLRAARQLVCQSVRSADYAYVHNLCRCTYLL
jgi:hypothetical protein